MIIDYNQTKSIEHQSQSIEQLTEDDSSFIIRANPQTNERYKIINIVYTNNHIFAIVHLDNGNIMVLPISEAWVDPELKNLNDGYLYRENNQIYIRVK